MTKLKVAVFGVLIWVGVVLCLWLFAVGLVVASPWLAVIASRQERGIFHYKLWKKRMRFS